MAGAPPELRSAIERIVVAGRRMLYDPETNGEILKQFEILRKQTAGGDADAIAQGVAALISMVEGKSKGPMPLEAIPAAATIIMMDAIDFLGEAGKLKVTDDLIAEAQQELQGYLMQKMGIGEEEIRQAQQGAAPQQPMPTQAPQQQRGIMGGA